MAFGISKEIIEDIRSRCDIVELIGMFVQLRRAGTNTYKGLCPFHQEKTPSFHVDAARQTFHCFGCGAHGDVIDLTAGLLGRPKSEAARRLEADFGDGGFVPPLGLAACKRELVRCRDALAPKSPGDAIADGYAEACTLDAWTGYLLDAGASRDETRLVEQKTARLMEGLRG